MIFDTKQTAYESLREFSTAVRARHEIVKFWSKTMQRWRYTRVFK